MGCKRQAGNSQRMDCGGEDDQPISKTHTSTSIDEHFPSLLYFWIPAKMNNLDWIW